MAKPPTCIGRGVLPLKRFLITEQAAVKNLDNSEARGYNDGKSVR